MFFPIEIRQMGKDLNFYFSMKYITPMNTESLSHIIVQSLNTPDLSKLKLTDSSFWKSQLKAAASLIPVAGGAVAEELQQYYDYKDDEFFRKFSRYLLGLIETTTEERQQFAEDIQKKAEDFSGNVILGMVDRLDNINKQTILANLTIARIKGTINIEDFFRLHSMLERIPYVDLKGLPRYKEPFYDDSGDTELLYATGVLELQTIDSDGSNKYILSKLGEKLLLFGCQINLEMERTKGTNVELNSITNEEIDAIVEEKIKANRPRVENGTLYYPDGARSGNMDDDDQFLSDLARGK